jgi:hypothetical protein
MPKTVKEVMSGKALAGKNVKGGLLSTLLGNSLKSGKVKTVKLKVKMK